MKFTFVEEDSMNVYRLSADNSKARNAVTTYPSWNIHLSFDPSAEPPLPFPLSIYGDINPTLKPLNHSQWGGSLTVHADQYPIDIGLYLDQIANTLWVGSI